jgi:RNA polymerase sigma-70 factor (ECF subfamily)
MTSITPTLLAKLQSPTQPEEAWKRLMDLCGPVVYGRCRRAGVPAQDAADIMQEVLVNVLKSIRDFRRDRPGDTFRGWLALITNRRIADYWRDRRAPGGRAPGGSEALKQMAEIRDSRDPGQGAPSDIEPPADDPGEGDALRRRALELIIDRFQPRTWQACWRVVIERRTVEVVAEELGMSVNAVRVARTRVLSCLRDEFAGLVEID